MGRFFAPEFRWMGNAGCGTKHGLREFQDNWQRPFQAAFSDKTCVDEARLFDGQWGAAFGRQEATHSGEFMGIAPTGKAVTAGGVWLSHFSNGKLKEQWVYFDALGMLQQVGAFSRPNHPAR